MLQDPALLERIPRRVYVDLDPAFVQLWESVCKIDMHFSHHTHFVTVAQAMGSKECCVPTCGRDWTTTFQPVVLGFRNETQLLTQVQAQIAERVVNDLRRIGRKQNNVAQLRAGQPFDFLLFGFRKKFGDR